MTIRKRLEQEEIQRLSPHAVCACQTQGREKPIVPCDLRTDFQRDRDRIIHCKSFRRLKYKTQCFLPDEGDHVRTRLTHTLEVSQIARTIARALRLNEDLTEAIALGHDLGHTCFGHMGERALNRLSPKGFAHNEQSLRIVERLENDGEGLNLCWEVRDGIFNHRSDGTPHTLEGQVVSIADRIAYINHDTDDAIRAGVLQEEDIPQSLAKLLGETHGVRINTMTHDVVAYSLDKPYVKMSPEIFAGMNQLRSFMFDRVYKRGEALAQEERTDHIITLLYKHYIDNPQEVPKTSPEDKERCILDHIAGMTDRFALRTYRNVFLPKTYWNE